MLLRENTEPVNDACTYTDICMCIKCFCKDPCELVSRGKLSDLVEDGEGVFSLYCFCIIA